jgi:predicted signal transduction protein with EAL and GGDEF domain
MTVADLLHDPTVHGLVLNYRDITERALYQEQLTQQAVHDPLTGLPNRARFQERLEFALEALRWMSVQIAMDDFGTGYSSLSGLSQLPLDILKIDRSFVERLDRDPEGRTIVYAIMSLANALIEVECQYG